MLLKVSEHFEHTHRKREIIILKRDLKIIIFI